MNKEKTKTIIFVNTTKEVESLVFKLKKKNINVEGFHGKMDNNDKQIIQARFNEIYSKITNHIDVLVTTSAFGMGINVPNIHLAIHYYLPFSLNDYYQQFGRIGRDKIQSKAYLLYNEFWETNHSAVHSIHEMELMEINDINKKHKLRQIFNKEHEELKKYVLSKNKWKFILNHFGSDEHIKLKYGLKLILEHFISKIKYLKINIV